MARSSSEPAELSVGQLAARSGVAVSTLHFYEAEGLIASRRTPATRSGDTRGPMLRPRSVHSRFAARRDTPAPDQGGARPAAERTHADPGGTGARLSAAWREDIDHRISQLQSLRDRLTGCIGCGCLSLKLCQLMNSEDWARTYATYRNTIEGLNGYVKDPADEALVEPGRRRVRGIAAQSIFVALLLMAANFRKIAAFRQLLSDGAVAKVAGAARRRRARPGWPPATALTATVVAAAYGYLCDGTRTITVLARPSTF